MTTRAYYHPRQIEIDLAAKLPPHLLAEIISLHGQSDKNNPALTCLINGTPLFIYRNTYGRYFARHYPGHGHGDGHTTALSAMSDQHRNQTEYCQRAADTAGLQTHLEHNTGNGTRLDLAIIGTEHAGIEIQRSHLTIPAAKTRNRKSTNAGYRMAWVSDTMQDPAWADLVPTVRLSQRGIATELDWRNMPKPFTANAIISAFKPTRTGLTWSCTREPTTIYLDELPVLMGNGEIVPVKVGKRGVVLADRKSAQLAEDCRPGATSYNPKPSQDAERERQIYQTVSRDCMNPHRWRDPDPYDKPICPECRVGKLYSIEAQQRGYCGVCKFERRAAAAQ